MNCLFIREVRARNLALRMSRRVLAICSILIALAGCTQSDSVHSSEQYDYIIAGGRVIDGTGNPWFFADVGVRDGKIAALGKLNSSSATEVIDISGKVVTPGFIDIHSHADDKDGAEKGLRSGDIRRRRASNIVTQGVTTVVVNSDGSLDPGLSIAEQRDQLASDGAGVNVALMVAFNAIRFDVMGDDFKRRASPEEMSRMQALVRKGMEEGAFGLTSGLEYSPAIWSDTEELIGAMRVVKMFDGVHISHIRSESIAPMWWLPSWNEDNPTKLLEAIAEIVEIAEQTGTKGVVSHLKVRGTTLWGQSKAAIDLIESARARGVEIYADQYPYNSSGSDGEIVIIPAWALGRNMDASMESHEKDTVDYAAVLNDALADPAKRADILRDICYEISFRGGVSNIIVLDYPDETFIGKSLEELSNERNVEPAQLIISLQLQGFDNRPGGARLRSFSLQESDIETIMQRPWVATSSDGGIALPEDGPAVHARYYGAFPRKLGYYVRSRGVTNLEDAVRAMTSLPAQILGLSDRGLIRVGMAADIVVFDEAEVQDVATFSDPYQYSRGIYNVFVNGVTVVGEGVPTDDLPGRVLRRTN